MSGVTPRSLTAYTVLGALAVFALFFNLGDRLLWGDEAETALLGLNVSRFGIPVATDGKNEITLLAGRDWNESQVWTWSPWLDEYVAATSFLVLGKSTVAARLPFAIIGLAAVVFLGVLAWTIDRNHAVVIVAVFLLVTCVPFLLHARQCRYYSVLILAQIWLLYGFHRLSVGHRVGGSVQIALALTAQFYSNYMVVPGNLLGLVFVAGSFPRTTRRLLRQLVPGLVGFLVLAVPWLLYARPAGQISSLGPGKMDATLAYYLGEIHFHLMPLPLFLVPAVVGLARRRKTGKDVPTAQVLIRSLWLFPAAHLALLALSPLVYFRYLTPMIPLLVLLAARISVLYVRRSSVRWGLVVALGLSNGIAMATGFPFRGEHHLEFPFVTYLRSVTRDYTNRLEDVVRFFEGEADSDQSLYVADPEFPLIFYTGMQVIDARIHHSPPDPPDWILSASASAAVQAPVIELPPRLAAGYRAIRLRVRRSPPGDCRPDPHAHRPFTEQAAEDLLIYRRR